MSNYEVEIRQIVPFQSEGCARANIIFRIGPLMVRGAKIFEKGEERWLSMPARRTKNGRWMDVIQFVSPQDKERLQRAVLDQYDQVLKNRLNLLEIPF